MNERASARSWRPSRRTFLESGAKATGLAAAALLTGCGVGGGAGKGGAEVSDDDLAPWREADLDWEQQTGASLVFGAQQHPWLQGVRPHLPVFEALTGIRVELQVSGESDFTTKLPVQLGGGSPTPDVFFIPSYPQYVASRWIEPLKSYQDDRDLTDRAFYSVDDLFGSARSFVEWSDGRDYAVPITAEVQTVFYRSGLVSGGLTSFPAIAAAAKDAKADGIAGIVMRGKAESTMAWTCQGYVFAHGGYVIDPSGKAAFDSPESIRAVDSYASLLRDAGPPGAAAWDWQQANQAFEGRKAAMVIESSVFGAEYMDPESSREADEVRAAPFPAMDGELRPNFWHWVLGMNRRSKKKTAAWLFLQWATSPPTADLLAGAGVSVPRRSVWRSDAFRKRYPAHAADVVLEMFDKADSKPYDLFYLHPKWPQVGTLFASAMSSVIAGGATARDAMRRAQRRAEKVLGDG